MSPSEILMDNDTLKKFDVEVDLTDQAHAGHSAEKAEHAKKRPARHIIYIYNELDGRTYKFTVLESVLIAKVIAAFYEKANRQPDPGDRMTCDGNGEDVLQFRPLTLEQYLEQGHCKSLEWTFAGPHGGA